MAYTFLPTDSSSTYYQQGVTLDGLEYLVDFLWADREGCWYISLADQDENPVAGWIKLVVNVSLLRRFRDDRLPSGVLFCVDMTGQSQDIAAPGDLGARVPLVYVTADDPDYSTILGYLDASH